MRLLFKKKKKKVPLRWFFRSTNHEKNCIRMLFACMANGFLWGWKKEDRPF